MSNETRLPLHRFLYTLEIVRGEGNHLEYSRQRLFSDRIDTAWVIALTQKPEIAERLEAFVSRYGRMQDTIAGKLLPRWLEVLAERPGSQIETLNRAERLGVIESVERWLEARNLRDRLIHEYMTSPDEFADNLPLAEAYSLMLLETYRRLRADAKRRLGIEDSRLPSELSTGWPSRERRSPAQLHGLLHLHHNGTCHSSVIPPRLHHGGIHMN